MNGFWALIAVFCEILALGQSENILGCGGFVKSHVPIDFSKVEIQLLTKQKILKDKITCAPTNGYYFVPLYDKGEYILELAPPPGWSFTPTRVNLVVDGVTDVCSQGKDINFHFKGFGITGKIESFGSNGGPEGVAIELNTSTESRKTLTTQGGSFFFTPVYPGNYIVRISKSKWKLWKESVEVVVTEGNTELPAHSLVIQGYDVKGNVEDGGEPIKDSVVMLFSAGKTDVKVDGCDKTAPVDYKGKKPLCYVKTNEQGVFKFGTVPHGSYYVVPFYNERNIYYEPNEIKFSVNHESVQLKEHFEIVGFNMNGRVLKSENGEPLPNARVFLNSQEVTKTDANGVYQLEKLKAGVYRINAVSDGVVFKEVTLKINPTFKIPDLTPHSYKVCGRVISDKSQTVTFSRGEDKIVTVSSDGSTGQFCEFLDPGQYTVEVVVDSSSSEKGLQFFPKSHNIIVKTEKTDPIVFSQLKATVSGRVQCLDKTCEGIKINLELVDSNKKLVIDIVDNFYTVSDIYPGVYEISLTSNRFCWRSPSHIVNVNNIKVEVPAFIQTGYLVNFVSSHDTQLYYQLPNDTKEHIVKIDKGQVKYCLEKPGAYQFSLIGCHLYEANSVSYNTNAVENQIFLNALKHVTTLNIESETKDADVSVTLNIEGVKKQVALLPYVKGGYQIELLLKPSESAVIIPQSDLLYFTPPLLSIRGHSDCQELGAMFKGVLGIVFKGRIKPALKGVLVTVETDNFDTLMTETDQYGVYKFPPLDKSKPYKIGAKKDSYVLVGPNDEGDFLAHKLAEIDITVLDNATGLALQGALLSLSGGDSYRSNLQTNENGSIAFHSLSPGEYFLRPMMKEYSFEPNSKIVNINEGETVTVQLIGKRVAYSAYGVVTSLNREPEENIVVLASGVGNCSDFFEESTSESSGQFRIRGLHPYCSYDITVKTSTGLAPIERSSPKAIRLDKVTSDVTGLQVIIFRPLHQMDLLVKVFAKNIEHYKSLRLKVDCESTGANSIYSSRIDNSLIPLNAESNIGILVQIGPIPLDGQVYSVHLESNLNNKLEPEPESFVANSSFKYIKLDFVVKTNINDADIKQTSIYTLFIIFGVMLAVYNIDHFGRATQAFNEHFGVYISDFLNAVNRKSTATEHSVDNVDIDQIVQSINAVKRKPKPKKVL